jgi:CBS domain-containing protein
LNLAQARQVMVPRRKIAAIDINTPLREVISIVAQSPYSRLPVYRDSIDNVVGLVHTKDLVRWLVNNGTGEATVASLMRPVTSVHESVTADRVLRHFASGDRIQALVVDEFGGTGRDSCTLEDVLAEVLGDVGDEFKAGDPGSGTACPAGGPAAWRHDSGRCRSAAADDVRTRGHDRRWNGHRCARSSAAAGETGHDWRATSSRSSAWPSERSKPSSRDASCRTTGRDNEA